MTTRPNSSVTVRAPHVESATQKMSNADGRFMPAPVKPAFGPRLQPETRRALDSRGNADAHSWPTHSSNEILPAQRVRKANNSLDTLPASRSPLERVNNESCARVLW